MAAYHVLNALKFMEKGDKAGNGCNAERKTNLINVVIVFPRGDAKVSIAPYLECISYIFLPPIVQL